MALAAFCGWLLGRWTLSGRIRGLREAIGERQVELEDCQSETQQLETELSKPQTLMAQEIASIPKVETSTSMPKAREAAAASEPVAPEMPIPEVPATPDVTSAGIVSGAGYTPDIAPNIPVPVPIESVEDNLKLVEGIGPKIEKLLKAEGIKTFAKLAATHPDTIYEYLKAAGPRFQIHNPGTWPEQAALARDGKWEELQSLQDSLNGGKA